ncbi:MAG: TonB-dependent receptor [Salibacteraceae bacterium]
MKNLYTIFCFVVMSSLGVAQDAGVVFKVRPVGNAEAFIDHSSESFAANAKGEIKIEGLESGNHTATVFKEGYQPHTIVFKAQVKPYRTIEIALLPSAYDLAAIEIVESDRAAQGMSKLRYIEIDGLYAAKKNDIVLPDEMATNQASNNSRQLFAKVPGINVQETDAGGLQMGIGSRGLDPKRTTNFNTRQDGYDISADALGYPESYYTPPIEAVERIELVRGAASLQYGTQFGGLLNFKMKRGNRHKALELTARQTIGSYNFKNTFTSLGGNAGGWNYYGYFQHKEGNSWRPNSRFNSNGFYLQVGRKLSDRWSIDAAFTHNYYNARQPGGLTDRQFENDPSQSYRERNWFRVNWNVANVTLNGKLSKNLSINSKTFVLSSSRAALGFLGNINRTDTGGARDLILGEFNNIGNETRLIQRFDVSGNPGAVLIGSRLYSGNTRNRQGKADKGSGPQYEFLDSPELEGSDFRFPSQNAALFAELLLPISDCWYVTPGIRMEHISTRSTGYYNEVQRHPLTGELLSRNRVDETSGRSRNVLLGGIGVAWRCKPETEFYANASQNYRAMNFSDVYVNNPNLVIASDMQDETGFTVDAGVKGGLLKNALRYDASLFAMRYNNRIGEMLKAEENEEGIKRIVNFRDNIADARFLGIEVFEELDITALFLPKAKWNLAWYNNVALVDARYMSSDISAFDDNQVENVPFCNFKTGIGFKRGNFSAGSQLNYVSRQFTDATNAEFFPDATVGVIPAFSVIDLSMAYTWKCIQLEGSVNNLTDEIYFTRRATGYPGPGIIPAERRMFFMTLQVKI